MRDSEMRDNVLQTERYPEISFAPRRARSGPVRGSKGAADAGHFALCSRECRDGQTAWRSGGDSNRRSHPPKSVVYRRIGTDLFATANIVV